MGDRELELKLSLGKDALDRLRRRPILRQVSVARPKRRKLRSIYYDTPDLRLYHAKISLRVRRVGGRWLQTAKFGTQIQHGVSNPIEVEQTVKGNAPKLSAIGDVALQQTLAGIISDQPLRPVFETCVWRATRTIKIGNTGTIELALDHGQILVGDQAIDIQEVELELKSGEARALLEAAEIIFAQDTVTVSKQSKAQRGYALLIRANDDQIRSARPQSGRKPNLEAQMSGAQALCKIGRAASDQILENWDAVQMSLDAEGPHQLRVGLRRLRTALKGLKPVLADSSLSWLPRDGRNLGRVVGRLRDADVLLEDIVAPAVKGINGGFDHSGLCDVLIEHRERERCIVRQSLSSPRWSRLRLNCILFEDTVVSSNGSLDSAAKFGEIFRLAQRALKKCWKRVRQWGRRIDKLSLAERHEMRKALKSLRYMTEFFLPLYAPAGAPSQARSFLKQLKKLQNVFGYLNDVALAEQMNGIIAKLRPDRPDLLQAVESVKGWHAQRADRAWNDAQQRWQDLWSAPRFWNQADPEGGMNSNGMVPA